MPAVPTPKSNYADCAQVLVSKHDRYALTPGQLFGACWRRENLLVSRNMFQYGFRFFITIVMVRQTGYAQSAVHIKTARVMCRQMLPYLLDCLNSS